MDYVELASKIERIARNAGLLIKNPLNVEITEKDGAANIVTNMDLASQRYIMKECSLLIPNSTFIAEEDDVCTMSDGYTWVIDPIDGTTNYAYGYQHSAISIALLNKGKGVIGVVYNPYLNECFKGINGYGSFLNDGIIEVSKNTLDRAVVIVGTSPYHKEYADKTFENFKQIFLKARDIRRTGSAVLDICYVACGRCDAYYEASLFPWDYAAGEVIVRNAKGKVSAITPDIIDYTKEIGMIAANNECYEPLVELVGDNAHE